MTDLHELIGAALDREQALAEAASPFWRAFVDSGDDDSLARTLRRVEADRRVLARHTYNGWGDCSWCEDRSYPCPDLLDLAARVDVGTSR